MKRMNEVFELPARSHCYGEDAVDLFDDRHTWQATFNSDDQAKAAAHAINHVDALADALELLLRDSCMLHVSKDKHLQAIAALAAYRGEK